MFLFNKTNSLPKDFKKIKLDFDYHAKTNAYTYQNHVTIVPRK